MIQRPSNIPSLQFEINSPNANKIFNSYQSNKMNSSPASKESTSIYHDCTDQDYTDPLLPNTAISTSPYQQHHAKLRNTDICSRRKECKIEEEQARQIAKHWLPTLFVVNLYSSMIVLCKMILNLESLFGLGLTVGATLVAHYAVASKETLETTNTGYD